MNRIFICLLAVMLVWSCSEGKRNTFVLEGRLDALTADTLLVHDITSFSDTVYKMPVKEGRFRLELAADSNAVFEVVDTASLASFVVFGNKGGVKVSGDMTEECRVVVLGGKENELFNSFKARLLAVRDSLAQDTAGRLQDAVKELSMTFVEKNPVSPVSAFVLERYLLSQPHADYARVKELADNLTGSVQDMPLMSGLLPVLEKKANAFSGKYMPLVTVRDRRGKFVSLSDFTGKKYCLLQFWASWSHSSRKHNTEIDSIYAALSKEEKKKIEIVGVSLDTDTLLFDKAVEEDSIAWRQVCDRESWDGDLAKRYAIQSVPDNVLISPEGYVEGRGYTPAELSAEFRRVLEKEKQKEKEKKRK